MLAAPAGVRKAAGEVAKCETCGGLGKQCLESGLHPAPHSRPSHLAQGTSLFLTPLRRRPVAPEEARCLQFILFIPVQSTSLTTTSCNLAH